jgi:hypothetical protein
MALMPLFEGNSDAFVSAAPADNGSAVENRTVKRAHRREKRFNTSLIESNLASKCCAGRPKRPCKRSRSKGSGAYVRLAGSSRKETGKLKKYRARLEFRGSLPIISSRQGGVLTATLGPWHRPDYGLARAARPARTLNIFI